MQWRAEFSIYQAQHQQPRSSRSITFIFHQPAEFNKNLAIVIAAIGQCTEAGQNQHLTHQSSADLHHHSATSADSASVPAITSFKIINL